jgi:hypothetical protein
MLKPTDQAFERIAAGSGDATAPTVERLPHKKIGMIDWSGVNPTVALSL